MTLCCGDAFWEQRSGIGERVVSLFGETSPRVPKRAAAAQRSKPFQMPARTVNGQRAVPAERAPLARYCLSRQISAQRPPVPSTRRRPPPVPLLAQPPPTLNISYYVLPPASRPVSQSACQPVQARDKPRVNVTHRPASSYQLPALSGKPHPLSSLPAWHDKRERRTALAADRCTVSAFVYKCVRACLSVDMGGVKLVRLSWVMVVPGVSWGLFELCARTHTYTPTVRTHCAVQEDIHPVSGRARFLWPAHASSGERQD